MDVFETPDLEVAEQKVKEQNEQLAEQALRLSSEFYHTFNTPNGKKVLEYLKEWTLELSALETNDLITAGNIPNMDQFMFIREGQNQIVRFIVRKMKEYKGK